MKKQLLESRPSWFDVVQYFEDFLCHGGAKINSVSLEKEDLIIR